MKSLPKVLSPTPFRSIQHSTGLFATPLIPSILMELKARTGVTRIMNWGFHLVEQLGQYFTNVSSIFFSHSHDLNRYDLYWAKSGTFYRYGDGGFINVRIPSFKPVLNDDFIQHSGRIMATYSGPMMVEGPFTLAQYPNLISRLLSLKKKLPLFW